MQWPEGTHILLLQFNIGQSIQHNNIVDSGMRHRDVLIQGYKKIALELQSVPVINIPDELMEKQEANKIFVGVWKIYSG